MERLFSPCNRLHDVLESQGVRWRNRHHGPGYLQEQNLEISAEELLSAERGFTFADLYAMLENHNTLAWLTPHAAVARQGGSVEQSWLQLHG
jgi:hypothetical protein